MVRSLLLFAKQVFGHWSWSHPSKQVYVRTTVESFPFSDTNLCNFGLPSTFRGVIHKKCVFEPKPRVPTFEKKGLPSTNFEPRFLWKRHLIDQKVETVLSRRIQISTSFKRTQKRRGGSQANNVDNVEKPAETQTISMG